MLVLQRSVGQRIMLLKDGKLLAVVSLEEIRSMAKAHIGFEAEPEIEIVREELMEPEKT